MTEYASVTIYFEKPMSGEPLEDHIKAFSRFKNVLRVEKKTPADWEHHEAYIRAKQEIWLQLLETFRETR